MVRLVVRRETPATLPGVTGLPPLAPASETVTPLIFQLSITSPVMSWRNPTATVRTVASIFIPCPPIIISPNALTGMESSLLAHFDAEKKQGDDLSFHTHACNAAHSGPGSVAFIQAEMPCFRPGSFPQAQDFLVPADGVVPAWFQRRSSE